MDWPFSRRGLFQGTAVAAGLVLAHSSAQSAPLDRVRRKNNPGWVIGHYSGAQAIAETLLAENVGCVYGIPGAQENELWDELKQRNVPYLLVTHEYSAACMADGYARATGNPGVLCVVPGPGVTNALTGLGEALLDSIPIVAIVGDVANGEKAKPFQVHCLNQVELLKPVCKCVYPVTDVKQIPATIRQAMQAAASGEPGPVAVVIPYNLLIEMAEFRSAPLAAAAVPFEDASFQKALALLSDKRLRVGIYSGQGCMDQSAALATVAELLQAPVATSVSGKGAIPENHPLAVGWGYGAHASPIAEAAFGRERLHPLKSGVDVLLAIGVKFSEVSTGYYGNPKIPHVIHVDANANNLGKVVPSDVCVHADAEIFLAKLLECGDAIRRPTDGHLLAKIRQVKAEQDSTLKAIPANKCGIDPLATIAALRKQLPDDGLLFTDVSASEHLAAECYRVTKSRTYFNPVDNQSMGWSIPAAIGAQRVMMNKVVATLTGDGCFLMSAMEMSTAAREGLPVKFVILDDHAYHYMQILQNPAYKRTTATQLAKIDYKSFAAAVGVGYHEIVANEQLEGGLRAAFCQPGPVLIRVQTDYGNRKIRWVEAVRDRYTKELSTSQKARFATRIAARTVTPRAQKND
jgi:acetolactate synthase I/II/III large subunit